MRTLWWTPCCKMLYLLKLGRRTPLNSKCSAMMSKMYFEILRYVCVYCKRGFECGVWVCGVTRSIPLVQVWRSASTGIWDRSFCLFPSRLILKTFFVTQHILQVILWNPNVHCDLTNEIVAPMLRIFHSNSRPSLYLVSNYKTMLWSIDASTFICSHRRSNAASVHLESTRTPKTFTKGEWRGRIFCSVEWPLFLSSHLSSLRHNVLFPSLLYVGIILNL